MLTLIFLVFAFVLFCIGSKWPSVGGWQVISLGLAFATLAYLVSIARL